MTLTYQTGVATLIQFILVSFFTLGSQTVSTVVSCHQDGHNCLINTLTAVIFFMVASIVFGVIWLIGYAAQARRSRRLAQLLIATEGFFALIALFSIKLNSHSHSALGLIASFCMLVMTAWIITLAFRLMRAGNARVVNPNRARRRRS